MKKRVPIKAEKTINARSIQLLLETSQNEYRSEHDRTTTIDYKAGIALPILATYFLAITQMNDYKAILAIPTDSFSHSILLITLFLTYSASFLLSLISLIIMAKVLFAKNYYRLNPVELYTDENLTQNDDTFPIKIMHLYFKAIEFNRKANNLRVKLYQRSWLLTFFSVLCYVIYVITKNNI